MNDNVRAQLSSLILAFYAKDHGGPRLEIDFSLFFMAIFCLTIGCGPLSQMLSFFCANTCVGAHHAIFLWTFYDLFFVKSFLFILS